MVLLIYSLIAIGVITLLAIYEAEEGGEKRNEAK